MKYLVVSTRRPNVPMSYDNMSTNYTHFEGMTVVGETPDKTLAQDLMRFYNERNKGQHCEVHSVMEDIDIRNLLWKHDDEYYRKVTTVQP